MFKLIEMSRRICIPCKYFNKDINLNHLLLLMINKFMTNKVIFDSGLFIIVTNIESHEVLPTIMNKSDIFISVRFQCLVFTLIEGETLTGTITDCTPHGLNVNLKFFKSIYIDPHYLPSPSKYENNGKRWIWIKKIGIDEYCFSINTNDEIRFKILRTKFNKFNLINEEKSIEPILSYATIKQELLGPVLWWD